MMKTEKELEMNFQITFKTTLILCQFQHCPSTMASHVHGGSTGWTCIAYLNMTEPGQCCPSPWTQFRSGNKRVCLWSIVSSGGSCDSVFYSNPQQQGYSKVCGRIIGYQYMEIHNIIMDSIAAGIVTLITTILMGSIATTIHFDLCWWPPLGQQGVWPRPQLWVWTKFPSWFTCTAQLNIPTSDDIEVRSCSYDGTGYRNVGIELIELSNPLNVSSRCIAIVFVK